MNAGMPALSDADSLMPEGWGKQNLSTLAAVEKNAVVGGPFGSDLVSKDYTPSGVPVIRGQNMGEKFVGNDFVYVSSEKAKSIWANTAKPNDIIFTQRGTLGQVSIVPIRPYPRYVISQSQMKITLDKRKCDSFYIWHFFNSTQQQQMILSSAIQTGVPHINLKIMREFSVSVPPLPEQQAIATALNDIDGLIASLDALIAKKRDIKQATMQQLLTGKTRLPGYAGEWATVELATLCSMKSGIGITSKSISEDGPYPVFGANGTRGFAATKTHSGVLPLIGRVGALCGNIQIARGDFFASEHAIVAEPTGKTDPEWLALALSRLGLNRLSEASAQPVLTVGKLAVLRVYAPTDPLEQRAISKIIFAMEAELNQFAIKRGKLCEVREGMMQQLLTGRIRLV